MKNIFTTFSATVFLAAALLLPASCNSDKALARKVDSLHRKMITVDTHTDTALDMLRGEYADLQVNFDKMREGGLDAVFFAIYKGQGKRDDSTLVAVADWAEEKLKDFAHYVDSAPGVERALTPADVRRIKKSGKACAIQCLENGYMVGKDLKNVERFYNLGARYITLSHNNNNDICDAGVRVDNPKKGFSSALEWGGLSPFGYQVVAEMNRLGMIIDVSHTADETVEDVLEASAAPIIASHSCARALCDHPRNLPDDLLRKIAAKGGVVQVTIYHGFVDKGDGTPLDVKLFSDHVEHIRDIAGVEHVGFGSDFDGGGGLEGINSALEVKNVTKELLRRGWSDHDIALFWGGNLLRVWEQVEAVATRLSGTQLKPAGE